MTAPDPKPFPCPFCQSSRVALVGGGLVFLHYECRECSEVWTAMAMPLRHHRSATTERERDQPRSRHAEKPQKIWLN